MLNDAALIFEGGGMRGAYTAGVIDALIEKDMEFTSCYGVSSGACHATTYLSKQFGRSRRIIVEYAHDKRYFSVRNLFKTGNMFGIWFMFKTLTHELDPYDFETARRNPAKFYVGVINVKTAESEYLQIRDPDEEYMKLAATMALPIISKKVKLNGKKYLDGGIVDSLPIRQAFSAGNKKVVLVLTQDVTYRKHVNKILPLLWLWYLPYQKFVGKIATRHIRYNKALEEIADAEKAGTAFVIRPKHPVNIGRLEFNSEKIEELYRDGYNDGIELMPKLQEFLRS